MNEKQAGSMAYMFWYSLQSHTHFPFFSKSKETLLNVIYASYKQCLLTVGNTEQTDVITRKVMKWTYLERS